MAKENLSVDANVSITKDTKDIPELQCSGDVEIESGVRGYNVDPDEPPDGGTEAWVVAFGSFFAYMCSFGWLQCKYRCFQSSDCSTTPLYVSSSC